jgi:diamine N-acetyltransferase
VDDPTIRSATANDVSALSELAKRTWLAAFGNGINAADVAVDVEERRSEAYLANALREKTILVAEAAGALVGYVQFADVAIPEVDVRAGDQELERLYVDSGLQGRGLGRRLLTAALEHPRLAGANRIFLQVWDENERAVRLYESFGFRKVGATTFSIGSEVMEDLVMLLERGGVDATERTEGGEGSTSR